MPVPEFLAECFAVRRVFGRFTAVDGVDLTVGPGEVVGLLGANGAGKTTLIRMLLGLLPVSGGAVRLFGQLPSRASRRRIGYLPQGLGLYEDLTIAETLAFSRAVFGAGSGSGPDPLRRYAGMTVRDLPLGVARRAGFAQVLAHAPELLLLDEPTSGVDPLARALALGDDLADRRRRRRSHRDHAQHGGSGGVHAPGGDGPGRGSPRARPRRSPARPDGGGARRGLGRRAPAARGGRAAGHPRRLTRAG